MESLSDKSDSESEKGGVPGKDVSPSNLSMVNLDENLKWNNKIGDRVRITKTKAIMKLGQDLIEPDERFRTYIRDDFGMKCFLTTKLGGPRWSDVISRTTFNIDDGRMIEHLQVEKGVNAAVLHRPLPSGVNNIRTVLHYKPMETAQNVLKKELNKFNKLGIFDEQLKNDAKEIKGYYTCRGRSPNKYENVD